MNRRRADVRLAVGMYCACILGVVLLAGGLPPNAFFAGDPGVKLIVARNAIAHPDRPLSVDLPHVGDRATDFVDPFFRISGGYAHAATPDLFPLVSAPLIARFGMRGAYVWPAVGFLVAIAAIAWIGEELDIRRSWTLGIAIAAVCSPLIFYGLEFWEHAPAVAAASMATALLVGNGNLLQRWVCGALFAVSVFLRPEGTCYVTAVAIALPKLEKSLRRRELCEIGAGALAILIPIGLLSALSSEHIFGSHITRNMSGIIAQWRSMRFEYMRAWFGPLLLAWAAMAAVAIAFAAARLGGRLSRLSMTSIVGGAALCTLVAAAGWFERSSLWNAAPAMIAITALPLMNRGRGGSQFLIRCGIVYLVLVCLTTPSDGGAQWGPRYLLFAFIPASILLADVFTSAVHVHRAPGFCMVAITIVANAVVDRNAYMQLRDTKQTYARIVDFVDRHIPPGGYVVTDVWWFGQVTAALYPTRTVLFVDTPAAARSAVDSLASNAERFYVVQSADEPSAGALKASGLADGADRVSHATITDRLITIDEYRLGL